MWGGNVVSCYSINVKIILMGLKKPYFSLLKAFLVFFPSPSIDFGLKCDLDIMRLTQ